MIIEICISVLCLLLSCCNRMPWVTQLVSNTVTDTSGASLELYPRGMRWKIMVSEALNCRLQFGFISDDGKTLNF